MAEIKMAVEVRVFDDPELCEDDGKKCIYLDSGCSLFNTQLRYISKIGSYIKNFQCRKHYQEAKEFKDSKGKF